MIPPRSQPLNIPYEIIGKTVCYKVGMNNVKIEVKDTSGLFRWKTLSTGYSGAGGMFNISVEVPSESQKKLRLYIYHQCKQGRNSPYKHLKLYSFDLSTYNCSWFNRRINFNLSAIELSDKKDENAYSRSLSRHTFNLFGK